MSRDIVTHFVNFAPIKYKTVHESYIVINNIPWWNIDFNRSYIIKYSKRNAKKKFDMLEHSEYIKYFDFFQYETKLLKDFKQYVFRKGKKKDKKAVKDIDALVDNHLTKIEEYKLKSPEEYKLKSPEYHPQSLSIQSQMTE
ncbi:hypothetical protein C2G38_2206623 [Gigaspora rosea]|uniref:Uncharacterized protein n=1 Tax=Gigaspora rosea TaxID=44941 RepID=A0A397UJF7_9GLOM|nr:hypothetical protein C2G38_2206623 [Gigaspora rosea]